MAEESGKLQERADQLLQKATNALKTATEEDVECKTKKQEIEDKLR